MFDCVRDDLCWDVECSRTKIAAELNIHSPSELQNNLSSVLVPG